MIFICLIDSLRSLQVCDICCEGFSTTCRRYHPTRLWRDLRLPAFGVPVRVHLCGVYDLYLDSTVFLTRCSPPVGEACQPCTDARTGAYALPVRGTPTGSTENYRFFLTPSRVVFASGAILKNLVSLSHIYSSQ